MSQSTEDVDSKVERAAGIIVGSQNTVGVAKAMEMVGFTLEERRHMTMYQKVRRRSQKLCITERKKLTPPPGSVRMDARTSSTGTSSLTNPTTSENAGGNENEDAVSVDENATIYNEDATGEDDASAGTNSSDVVRPRQLLTSLKTPNSKSKQTTSPSKKKSQVKHRRTSKELQRYNSKRANEKEQDKKAMKRATQLVVANKKLPKNHPDKKSIAGIVDVVNQQLNSNINDRTVSRYVRKGMIGISPLKQGPVGDFSKTIYSALKGAYNTYLKLEQAESKKQSTTKAMSKLVNAVVNTAGHSKSREDLTRKLKKDTANQFTIAKANMMEQRRILWTTSYNLDVWFDSWKAVLIELGFGREKAPGDDCVGEVFFFPGQLNRIGNIDETDGSIDDTTGQRGGCPAMTLLSSEISGGATAANKTGYSATIICGSNAAGEPFPPHFQLKSMAQDPKDQRLSIDWFSNCKNVMAKFGHREQRSFPCTFGMNEKAGMNSVELPKYVSNSILPLYPDIEDTPGKRVILKLDSGPGRMNIEMLASLRLKGLYIIPGVPNSTSITQETDQNYGPFKSAFRSNIRTLAQARFDKSLTVAVIDLPLLVFGGKCSKTQVDLVDAFNKAFSNQANLSVWKKCGAVPLTRLPLQSNKVRQEVPVEGAAAQLNAKPDNPGILALKRIEDLNKFYCDVLTAHGYDGKHLVKKAPTRSRYVGVTEAHSKERIAAIKTAKSAGQMFYATGGRHLNSDEFFQAQELKRRELEIAEIEKVRKNRRTYAQKHLAAIKLIKEKGELTSQTEKKFTIPEVNLLLKWKKVKPPPGTRKNQLVDLYFAAERPKTQKPWTVKEEKALQALKDPNVVVKDTRLGVEATQMAKAVRNNLSNLDENTITSLKTAIEDYESNNGPNVV